MIKRIDVEPTDDQLESLIQTGNLGRNEEIADLISLIDKIDGSFSIFLDSEWGSGKTFFVKQCVMVLQALNEKLKYDKKEKIQTIDEFKDLSLSKNYYPIYYNAWKYDSDVDPLVTLIGALALEVKGWDDKTKKDIAGLVGHIIGSTLGLFGVSVNIDSIRDALGEKILKSLEGEMEIRQKFDELIKILVKDKADKIVLFIDELDRCSPAFAMKLLERVKFIFGSDEIIIIFSTHVKQLSNTIRKLYGEGTDGDAYLSRFYDMKFQFKSINGKTYIPTIINTNDWSAELSKTIIMLTEGFTLRDCNRYLQELEKQFCVEKEVGRNGNYYRGYLTLTFFWHYLVPILLSLKITKLDDYQKIINGNGKYEFKKLDDHEVIIMARENKIMPNFTMLEIYDSCFTDTSIRMEWDELSNGQTIFSLKNGLRECAQEFILNDRRGLTEKELTEND